MFVDFHSMTAMPGGCRRTFSLFIDTVAGVPRSGAHGRPYEVGASTPVDQGIVAMTMGRHIRRHAMSHLILAYI
ncbi:MAG TPA: hypothetical protein VME63_07835 [Dyella sp.]|uniref:hypothetical protein n=1 Tax=Dyella sp. TaxID=1869338 RepID=UPI002C6014EF|nr:hypothetical protein [Dyella sp.]HTV85300.1 hypothetical protein [Dyella sp.]